MKRFALAWLTLGLALAAGSLAGKELKEKVRLSGHSKPVLSLSFSPNSKRLITGGLDGTARLFDGVTGKPVKAYELETCEILKVVSQSENPVQAVMYASATRTDDESKWSTFAVVEEDGTVRVFEIVHGYLIRPLTVIKAQGKIAAFSMTPDGKAVALTRVVADAAGKVYYSWIALHTLAGKTEVAYYEGDVRSIAFSPDGRLLAAADMNGVVDLYDVSSATPRKLSSFQTPEPRSVAFSPDGEMLAVATGSDVLLLKVGGGKLDYQDAFETGIAVKVQSVSFSPDGNFLAFAQGQSVGVCVLICRHLNLMSTKTSHSGEVRAVTFSPDGKMLASASDDQSVILWDFADEVVK